MAGGFAIRESGAHVMGQMGGRRFGWMHSERTVPLFAVMFVQKVLESYYNASNPNDPLQQEKRARWVTDVAEYELLADQMTERNLWSRVNILLVHVELFHRHDFDPIWPPPNLAGVEPPWPSHINEADSVIVRWDPSLEHMRLTLEQRGSSVYPQLMYVDIGQTPNWYPDHMWPGLPAWFDQSPVPLRIQAMRSSQWVTWASDILTRVLQ